MSVTELTECLACGSNQLRNVLDFSNQPLANSFHKPGESLESYPLKVNHCSACDHLQLGHIVDPKLIYTNYVYVSGTSKTYRDYMDWYAKYTLPSMMRFDNKSRRPSECSVLDIGCNDGSQLDSFKKLGWKTYGVDPAENLYPISSAKHDVICGYWDSEMAKTYPHKVDLITSQNAFAHIPNPLQYLKDAASVLKDDGYIFISTSQANMVPNGEFDTIYHEHISFYNSYSMDKLADRAGLHLEDIQKADIHGTSYIFILSKRDTAVGRTWKDFYISNERRFINEKSIELWAENVKEFASKLKQTVDQYHGNGYKIIGYGAAAKGNTLLNFTGIGEHMMCIVDDNPLKVGLETPGSNVPVVGPEALDTMGDNKTLFIPLAWNYYADIKEKIKLRRGYKTDMFLRYHPKIVVSR